MNKNEYIRHLKDLRACPEAIEWTIKTDGTPQELWDKCERGDWLLWRIGEIISGDDESQLRRLILAKAYCSKLVVHLMKDERSQKAVKVAEQFGLGQATRAELDAACTNAAYVAADAADAAACTNAAYAAYAAADAAYAAADAAYAAAYAAYAAYAADARKETLKRCADEIRCVFPFVEIARARIEYTEKKQGLFAGLNEKGPDNELENNTIV